MDHRYHLDTQGKIYLKLLGYTLGLITGE